MSYSISSYTGNQYQAYQDRKKLQDDAEALGLAYNFMDNPNAPREQVGVDAAGLQAQDKDNLRALGKDFEQISNLDGKGGMSLDDLGQYAASLQGKNDPESKKKLQAAFLLMNSPRLLEQMDSGDVNNQGPNKLDGVIEKGNFDNIVNNNGSPLGYVPPGSSGSSGYGSSGYGSSGFGNSGSGIPENPVFNASGSQGSGDILGTARTDSNANYQSDLTKISKDTIAKFDKNKDGLTAEELAQGIGQKDVSKVKVFDTDGDGKINENELKVALAFADNPNGMNDNPNKPDGNVTTGDLLNVTNSTDVAGLKSQVNAWTIAVNNASSGSGASGAG